MDHHNGDDDGDDDEDENDDDDDASIKSTPFGMHFSGISREEIRLSSLNSVVDVSSSCISSPLSSSSSTAAKATHTSYSTSSLLSSASISSSASPSASSFPSSSSSSSPSSSSSLAPSLSSSARHGARCMTTSAFSDHRRIQRHRNKKHDRRQRPLPPPLIEFSRRKIPLLSFCLLFVIPALAAFTRGATVAASLFDIAHHTVQTPSKRERN